MGVLYKVDKRRLLPRWRSLASEVDSLEPAVGFERDKRTVFSSEELTEQVQAWELHRTLPFAADLITAATVLGREAEFPDAAAYLLKVCGRDSILYPLAQSALQHRSRRSPDTEPVLEIAGHHNVHTKGISRLRKLLKREDRNPVAWIEIALHYFAIGEENKSKFAIQSALAVDRHSRYIVRSAARYFHHAGSDDFAIKVLHRSDHLKHDPWLMASEIAFASLLGRQTRLAKSALRMIEDRAFADKHLSELASAMGTLEMEQGNMKGARRLAEFSMRMPNDNSFAQAMWHRDNFGIPQWRFETMTIPMAWEARAQLDYNNCSYKTALGYMELWRRDEPFSVRPVYLMSYVHGTILQEWSKSVELIKAAIPLHSDAMLLNNLVYDYLMMGDVESAEKHFADLMKLAATETEIKQATIAATSGLLCFRQGRFADGRALYRQAISAIARQENDYLRAIAVANYAREEILAMDSLEDETFALGLLDKYCRSRMDHDVQLMVQRTDDLLKRRLQEGKRNN